MSELVSTRDPEEEAISYSDAILQGLAPDQGLYVPTGFTTLSEQEIGNLPDSYDRLSAEVQGYFIDEGSIARDALATMLADAYGPDNFELRKSDEPGNVTPVDQITDRLYVQELSLGPTGAFKDMALQSLGRQMEHVLGRLERKIRINGATSGDTGSAAEDPFVGSDLATIYMLSPLHGMSPFQRAQMGMQSGGNIHNLSVRGDFDDCQDLVKALKDRPGFEDLGALNSINWGRIVAQIPYYFAGYKQVVGDDIGREVDFVVPSGNFGNILAGHMARRMGLPIRNLIVATNENNVLHRAVQEGIYEQQRAQKTSSPSMDISKSSNLERLIFEMLGDDPVATARFMEQFSRTQRAEFPHRDSFKRMGFDSGTSTSQDRLDSIKWVYETTGHERLVDPHTADGVTVARRYIERGRDDDTPVVVMSTALPVKFEETIEQALGFVPPRPERFDGIEEKVPDDAFTVIDNDLDQLADYLDTHAAA